MGFGRRWGAGLFVLLIQTMAVAQPGQHPAPGGFAVPGGMGGMAPAGEVPVEPPPKVESQAMPGEKFENTPLDEVLQFIHDKVPEFNSVVVRSPGVQAGYPVIPGMSVKNVSIGQFLEFLEVSFPGVNIQRIKGPTGPLYVIKVTAGPMDQPNFADFPGGFAPGFGGGMPGAPMPGPAVPPGQPQNVVVVYRLNDIVASLVAGKEGGRELQRNALTDILSLVQSALEESGEKEQVVLKVHESTQTLLFRGSPMKQAVLEQVLTTLRPAQDPIQAGQVAELKDKLRMVEAQREIDSVRRDEATRSYEKEVDEMRARTRELQKVADQLQHENAELLMQLEQAKKSAPK
jgi:hypothetical protein